MLDILWATRGTEFAFVAGAETAFLAGLCMGARAVMGQGCCINPGILAAVQDRHEAGDLPGAMDAQRSVNVLVESCPNPVDFLKRYAAEQGYLVQPYDRSTGDNPYETGRIPLTREQYDEFKRLLEAELTRYA